jgi:hypothetical protein
VLDSVFCCRGFRFGLPNLVIAEIVLSLSLIAGILSPAEAATVAANHAETLPSAVTVRYLQLTGTDDAANAKQVAAVNYLVNSVSRNRVIQRVALLADQPLVAIDFAAFADPIRFEASLAELLAAWERVVAIDPYWHIPVDDADKKKSTVTGPWCADALTRLEKATASAGGILRVDQFVARAGADSIFNDFAGVPATQGEYFKQFGIDEKAIVQLLGHTAANIPVSGVTFKPRRIVNRQGPLGPYIATEDGAKDNAASNPFHFPVSANGQSIKVDAYEVFALKSNGFWGVAAFDGEDKRVDAVPDVIAKNRAARDGIIRNGCDCFICHTTNGGEAGIQIFDPTHQAKLNAGGIAGDPAIVGVIAAAYDPRTMKRSIERAQADHHDACVDATGMEPKEAVAALAEVYLGYRDGDVDIARAAYECGVTVDEFRTAIGKPRDPMLGLLLLETKITRGSWEGSLPDALTRVDALKTNKQGE